MLLRISIDVSKKASVITNSVIAAVLLVICFFVATTDVSNVYISVSAPIYNGSTEKKNISFMFNVRDNSAAEFIPQITETLENAGAGATWFLSGEWVQQNMQQAKNISLVFEVGNHGYSHKDLTAMKEEQQKTEMQTAHDVIKSVTGVSARFFTPPFGKFNKTTLKTAESMGYKTIMCSKDTTKGTPTANTVFISATENAKNGDLILMMPTENTLYALPHILSYYKTMGFRISEVGKSL